MISSLWSLRASEFKEGCSWHIGCNLKLNSIQCKTCIIELAMKPVTLWPYSDEKLPISMMHISTKPICNQKHQSRPYEVMLEHAC